jgi:HSP20 family protein
MPERGLAVQRAEERIPLKPSEFEIILRRMDDIFNTITRRAYELFECSGRTFGHDLDDWLQAEAEILHPVHVDIVEFNDALTVHAEVPGFTDKELEIMIHPRQLTIAGKRETRREGKNAKKVYSERCADRIYRLVCLPIEIDPQKAKATLKDGVLEVEMIKAERAKTVNIEPKAAGTA